MPTAAVNKCKSRSRQLIVQAGKQHRGARAALLSFIHPAHKEERAMGCQQQQQARLTTFVASATLTKNSLSSVFSFEAPMNTPSLRNFVAQGT
jgi:hypothetical protein